MRRIVVLLLLSAAVSGYGDGRPFCVVPQVETPPSIEAEAGDPAWSTGVRIRLDQALGESTGAPVRLTTEVTVLSTADALYFRFACSNPASPKLKTVVRQRDEEAYLDESVELFIDRQDGSDYFHLVVNAAGGVYDGRKFHNSWNGDWTAATRVTPGGWEAILRIPFVTLGGAPAPGSYWLLNLCRNAYDAAGLCERSAWIPPGYHRPLGLLCFGEIDARPVFKQLHADVAKLRRFEAVGTPDDRGPGERIAAAVAGLEAQYPDPARIAPDRFAELLTAGAELSRAIEPLTQKALMRVILEEPER